MKFLKPALGVLALILLVALWQPVSAQSATLTATVKINPLDIQVFAPTNVVVGEWFDIKADITNRGSQIVNKTFAKANVPSGLSVRGKKKKIGVLGARETKTIIWRAKATRTDTNLLIQIDVNGTLMDEEISASSDSKIILASQTIVFFLFRLIFGA